MLEQAGSMSAGSVLQDGAVDKVGPVLNCKGYDIYDLEDQSLAPASFHEAAERGDTKAVLSILDRSLDFNINAKDSSGRAAIHWAVERGHVKTVQALLDYDASPLAKEFSGRTPLFLAVKRNDVDMLEVLAAAMDQATVEELANKADNSGITPMSLCREKMDDHQESFQWLMKHGAVYESSAGIYRRISRPAE